VNGFHLINKTVENHEDRQQHYQFHSGHQNNQQLGSIPSKPSTNSYYEYNWKSSGQWGMSALFDRRWLWHRLWDCGVESRGCKRILSVIRNDCSRRFQDFITGRLNKHDGFSGRAAATYVGVHEKGVSFPRESRIGQAPRNQVLAIRQDLLFRFKSMNGPWESKAPKWHSFNENYRSVRSDSSAQGDFYWSAWLGSRVCVPKSFISGSEAGLMISDRPFTRTCSRIARGFNLQIHVDSPLLSNSGMFVDVSIDNCSREANAIIARMKRIGL